MMPAVEKQDRAASFLEAMILGYRLEVDGHTYAISEEGDLGVIVKCWPAGSLDAGEELFGVDHTVGEFVRMAARLTDEQFVDVSIFLVLQEVR